MLHGPHSLRCAALATVILASLFCAAQMNTLAQFNRILASDERDNIFWFTAPMPLGAEAFDLKPANQRFYLLACMEDTRFDRLEISRVRSSRFVIDSTGHLWHDYPSKLAFRVTATALADILRNLDSDQITEPGDLNSFLLGLKFRLKVYRGLQVRVLPPDSVKMIGMPSDVPYNERVYRVSFDSSGIPVDDRLVLEVLSPQGQLLTRFHLELL